MNVSRSVSGTLVAILLSVSLLLSEHHAFSAPAPLPFDDISGSFARDAIVDLASAGIVSGNGNRMFEPGKAVSRAEFVTMLDRLFAFEPITGAAIQAFSDVPKNAWYYPWVQSAVDVGIATGLSLSTFGPSRVVTREEAAVLIARALKQTTEASESDAEPYVDEDDIEAWAKPSVARLRQLGLMSGSDGTFRPKDPLSKAEAAALFDKAFARKEWSNQFKTAPASAIQLGWQYNQTTAQYEQQVSKSNVNTLSPRWLFLSKTGGVINDGTDASLLKWAHQNGKKVWAMVGNRSDPDLTYQMLSNTNQRTALIQSLTNAAQTYRYDGLNLDFENVSPETRVYFSSFVADLASALHAINVTLSVNVSPDLGTDWTAAFDYASLGASADYIVLMGYDEHWDGSPIAGSVASLPWVQRAMATLTAQIPAGKTIVALPLYTRDWTISPTGTTSAEWSLPEQNSNVATLGLTPIWDSGLAQYVASYTRQGALHQIWLEDGRSLSQKLALGEAYGVAGYAYWYMGGDSPDLWASLRNVKKFASYRFN